MLDINGNPLREGDTAQVLCEVIEVTDHGVVLRVMNSDLQLSVDAKHDEVLGGLVADSELTLFESSDNVNRDGVDSEVAEDDQADGVKAAAFE
jgi:hypothetical protein